MSVLPFSYTVVDLFHPAHSRLRHTAVLCSLYKGSDHLVSGKQKNVNIKSRASDDVFSL